METEENWFSEEELRDGLYNAQRVFDKAVVYFATMDDDDFEKNFDSVVAAVETLDGASLRALVHIGNLATQLGIGAALRRDLDLEVVFG